MHHFQHWQRLIFNKMLVTLHPVIYTSVLKAYIKKNAGSCPSVHLICNGTVYKIAGGTSDLIVEYL